MRLVRLWVLAMMGTEGKGHFARPVFWSPFVVGCDAGAGSLPPR